MKTEIEPAGSRQRVCPARQRGHQDLPGACGVGNAVGSHVAALEAGLDG